MPTDPDENSPDQYSKKLSNNYNGAKSKQNISAIPEDGAEYLHTEEHLDDSL